MQWCRQDDIAAVSDRLRVDDGFVKVDFARIVDRATDFVRNDVFSHVDLDVIDALPEAPQPLVHLTRIKAEELAWVELYGMNANDQYEIKSAGQNYQRRLDAMLRDIRDGRLDRHLRKPAHGIAPEHECIHII